MTSKLLDWQSLLPDTTSLVPLCVTASQHSPLSLLALQPRLENTLRRFCDTASPSRFMLLKATESYEYLSLITEWVKESLPPLTQPVGYRYQINGQQVSGQPALSLDDNFAAQATCLFNEWVEHEQLFGCLRYDGHQYHLSPGLVHLANHGVLVLSVRTLLAQPQLWLRLKNMVTSQKFCWLSPDESRPLALQIPPMPLDLRVILVGDRLSLGDLQEFEPELTERALYTEFEKTLTLDSEEDITAWARYVCHQAQQNKFSAIDTTSWVPLLEQAVRFTEDKTRLPLCPIWLSDRLADCRLQTSDTLLTAKAVRQAQTEKRWRESYLLEQSQLEILQDQIYIATSDAVIGQINALSVLQYPGHPLAQGEPSRVTCVVHLGDGEITDVERKVDLGGSIHAKGMMIMQAFLINELELEQQFPFSASLVFEQSYGEVDGDSASLAELCALISALSQQPISQSIAVTGSVDQFGNVQPIGGINEKIEGFFAICQNRGLTGEQGVIIPEANLQHLSLNEDIIEAVKAEQFHIWSVDCAADAIQLLIGLPWRDEKGISLQAIIQERILMSGQDKRRLPWFLRWLTWFNSSS